MLCPYEGAEDPNVPPCPYCPMVLSTQPRPAEPMMCQSCGAHRATLMEIDPEKLKVPDICFQDFMRSASRARPSVAPEELERFQKWTEDFGQEG
jgi:hypothetical protein